MAASQDRRLFWRSHAVDRMTGAIVPREPAPFTGKARRRRHHYVGEKAGQPWKYFKDGSAIDGRGDRRSAKRLLRQRWCARAARAGHRITSGRAWVRLRRFLRWTAKGATR